MNTDTTQPPQDPKPQAPTANQAKAVEPQDQKISFKQYKTLATQEDVNRFKQKMRPHWWENIFIIGSIIYEIRVGFLYMMIDRGPLRRNILKWELIFQFATLFLIRYVVAFVSPWPKYWMLKLAIKDTENMIAQDAI